MKYSKNIIKSAFSLECSYSEEMLKGLCQSITAHAIVLAENDIIPINKRKKIFIELKKLLKFAYKKIQIDNSRIDLFTNLDDYLKTKISSDAGWLKAGKARRESVNVSFFITLKELTLKFEKALINLGITLKSLSDKNSMIIMNDYTYLQHAQPTTLSHYLYTYIEPIKRDLIRISEVYKLLDTSTGGSGSVNGTRLPISKKRIADLLSFKNITNHSRDALWLFDVPLQLISTVLITMTNLSRFCSELIIWNSKEFNFIDIPAKFCRQSIIMPQKKNPYALSYIRGLVNSVSGRFSEFMNMGKEISGFPDSRIFIYSILPNDLKSCTVSINLLNDILSELKFNKTNIESMLINSSSFSTDLAELVMMKFKYDYKTSYSLIRNYIQKHKTYSYENFKLFLKNKNLNDDTIDKNSFDEILNPNLLIKSRSEIYKRKVKSKDNLIFNNYKFKNFTKLNKLKKIDDNLFNAIDKIINEK